VDDLDEAISPENGMEAPAPKAKRGRKPKKIK
jgi:hypothetical protein